MDIYINKTRTWIQSYVIRLNLCPFASYAVDKDKIHFQTELSKDPIKQLNAFWRCVETLQKSKQQTSGILILPNGLDKFDDYLNMYDKVNWVLEDLKLEDTYQLASFHPKYLFKNEPHDAVSHFTNRSPYPIIHILSVDEVSQAIESHGSTENIPSNNIMKLESLGLEKITRLLNSTQ